MLISYQFFSCEVIRDWKTGESLCYAFIEFEKVCFLGMLYVDSLIKVRFWYTSIEENQGNLQVRAS